jgi:hypothetical protein
MFAAAAMGGFGTLYLVPVWRPMLSYFAYDLLLDHLLRSSFPLH